MATEFPVFKPLELSDREEIHRQLWDYQSEISEYTFSNLFLWRRHYNIAWAYCRDWLVFHCRLADGREFCLQPLGPWGRALVVRRLLEWLRDDRRQPQPSVERADSRLLTELADVTGVSGAADRDHFDYVYHSARMISLEGRDLHAKRNNINRFLRAQDFTYTEFREEHVAEARRVKREWCDWRRCRDETGAAAECAATDEALDNFAALGLTGGVILIEGQVAAFSFGELLNHNTAVIHIEKASPRMPELFTLVNQQFAAAAWKDTAWINREQDLGHAGLRQAKMSYQPDHLVEKYRIGLAGA